LAWLALCCLLHGAAARAAEWRLGPLGFGAGNHIGTQLDSSGHLALSSFAGANLALGAGAVAGENALTGSRSLTDGDRGVTRVRILPGKTFDVRPLFYLKGYRIEVAAEDTPDDWVLVAQQIDNGRPTVGGAYPRRRSGAAA
jgi:hypothetical protein